MSLSLAVADSPNLAPAEPLLKNVQQAESDMSVWVESDWFKKQKIQLENEDKQVWENEALKWAMVFSFIEGNFLLKKSKYGKGWRAAPPPNRTDVPVYGYALAGFYSDNIRAKWTQSNTDIRWRPTRDTDDSTGAAKGSQRVHDFYKRKLYTQWFRQMESLLAQCGKYARYYYYTDDERVNARREQTETQTLQFGTGSWFCPDCGDGGEVDELAGLAQPVETMAAQASEGLSDFCPSCGSPNVEIEQSEPLDIETVTGYDEYEHGDIVCETVPAFELKHELNKLPHESSYLIRRRRIRVSVLEEKFPNLKIKQSKSEDWGLNIEDSLKRGLNDNVNTGSSRDNEEPTAEFIQVWLDTSMYPRVGLRSELKTVTGEIIPAGTKLKDRFSSGMYLCFIDGIDGVVELRNESHKDYWVGAVYRPRAMSALGSGIEDIVEGNRQYNLIMSIIYTQLRTSAMPATLFDERLLPNGVSAYLGSLSNIPVNLSALEDRRLQDSVYQLMPQPPTAQHFNFAQQLEYYIQKASRVTEFSGGLPNVNNKTATGAEITQSLAQSLFAPQLALKAEMDRRGAEIVLSLFKKYCIDEVYISLAGKRGELDGMWIKAADITTDIFAEVVPDSYLPQTNLERRERWDGFLNRVGGLQGLKIALQESPEQVEQIAELFDVDLASADYSSAAELARERIEQMKAAIPMLQMQQMPPVQMQADPMTGEMVEVPVDPVTEAGNFLLGILQPQIEPEEIGHLSAIQYLRSCLTEDEFKRAPQELRAGIKAMIYAHIDGLMAEGQLTGMVAMAGQMPMLAPEDTKKPTNKNRDVNQMTAGQPTPMEMAA